MAHRRQGEQLKRRTSTPGGPTTRTAHWVAGAVALTLLLASGCAAERATVRRNESANDTGYIGGGSSLTQVPPADRKPAPVVSGPQLGATDKTLSTADYPGKVLVVNVWGSWCAPCRKEAPDLAAASKKTADAAAFVGIDIRDPDPGPAEAFVRVFKIPYPSIYDPDGKQLVKFAGDLPPAAIPSTLIIDKQGRIAVRVIGIISEKTMVAVVNDIAQGR